MITKDKIRKLLLTEPLDIVDEDMVYFQLDEELELELCVCYDAYAHHDFDGFEVTDTYGMKITCVYIEKGNVSIHLDYTKEELLKLSFNDQTEENIRENYLTD